MNPWRKRKRRKLYRLKLQRQKMMKVFDRMVGNIKVADGAQLDLYAAAYSKIDWAANMTARYRK